ncbi:membrane protein implicated in regulation of membrane protease activity [Dysgonomonas hofstadii]|uniref:Membrane protein implicated in regulation of membrane protease activity n=1 Tax=Dysgonomonas hofstadii TaxID=637886 RepID=A0A840CIB2_9BACT|nr:hypothetical protein [Dysgonomonas hofstadii]MBB4035700.1 membrane protein implicated in regulation of membrane protease activity [Dysgonomonas hofstadii]
MKKQRPVVFYVITLFFIWGIITIGLCSSLLFNPPAFIISVLAILFFTSLFLLLFCLWKLFSAYKHENDQLENQNDELEKAINRLKETPAGYYKKNTVHEKEHST